ncbi:MAG TPA: sulfate ABC transporter ATP-binding protein [Beijerinckiaceae bacterium]|nr:sulfate ABC transporter ATP-binding protein [Beijerinckiaceae bacterium]
MLTPLPQDIVIDMKEVPDAAPHIGIHQVAKEFGAYPALCNVSLDVAHGELLALLGPSGSGKTTLLRVIAGLETPDAGRVVLGGVDTTRLSVQERGVGFVFQNYALFKNMNVFDNISYGLRVRSRKTRPSQAEIAKRVAALLELVQLDGLEKRFPAQLSGGQRQRVALARALAIEPKVLLLDEPFGALDAKVRKELRRWLRDIHKKTGQTTIFVTHDQDEAMELADRVAILNQGRIEQVGTPEEIYAEPASSFIASFIGQPLAVRVDISAGTARLGHQIVREGLDLADGPAQLFAMIDDIKVVKPPAGDLIGKILSLGGYSGARRAEIGIDGSVAAIELAIHSDENLRVGEVVGISVDRPKFFPA